MLQILAKSYELTNGKCYVDGVLQSTTGDCTHFIKAFLGIGALILIPFLIIGLALFIFWVVMLAHAIKNDDLKDRNIWLIGLIAGFFFGVYWIIAFVYYFAAKMPYDRAKKSPPPANK